MVTVDSPASRRRGFVTRRELLLALNEHKDPAPVWKPPRAGRVEKHVVVS
jgi:hypothetical protein